MCSPRVSAAVRNISGPIPALGIQSYSKLIQQLASNKAQVASQHISRAGKCSNLSASDAKDVLYTYHTRDVLHRKIQSVITIIMRLLPVEKNVTQHQLPGREKKQVYSIHVKLCNIQVINLHMCDDNTDNTVLQTRIIERSKN